MNSVIRALKNCGSKLMHFPNVVGVGYGHKHVGGRSTGKESLVVLVEKKVPAEELSSDQIIPRSMNQCLIDVVEVGEIVALGRTDRQRPARPGLSIGHFRVTAGTFGAVVYDAKTGEPLILSNNHVLANSSNGRDGRAKIGDAILQPGRYDGGTDDDVIARLHRFVPIELEVSEPDCRNCRRCSEAAEQGHQTDTQELRGQDRAHRTATNLWMRQWPGPCPETSFRRHSGLGCSQGTAEVVVGQK